MRRCLRREESCKVKEVRDEKLKMMKWRRKKAAGDIREWVKCVHDSLPKRGKEDDHPKEWRVENDSYGNCDTHPNKYHYYLHGGWVVVAPISFSGVIVGLLLGDQICRRQGRSRSSTTVWRIKKRTENEWRNSKSKMFAWSTVRMKILWWCGWMILVSMFVDYLGTLVGTYLTTARSCLYSGWGCSVSMSVQRQCCVLQLQLHQTKYKTRESRSDTIIQQWPSPRLRL